MSELSRLVLTAMVALALSILEIRPALALTPERSLVHLPILNFRGQQDVCTSWIDVMCVGCGPSKAALVTYGEPGFCPPQAAGPLKVVCTGLLGEGRSWTLIGSRIPTGSKSGFLVKFTAQRFSELGLDDDLGFDAVVADLMCETLFFGVLSASSGIHSIGSSGGGDIDRFRLAYRASGTYAGIPMDLAAGSGVLAAEVKRECPGDATPGTRMSARYRGISDSALSATNTRGGDHLQFLPLVLAERSGMATTLSIQNAEIGCAIVEIWFKAQSDCARVSLCEIFALPTGESREWDASACLSPGTIGAVWIRSSLPLAVAADVHGGDVLMTYVGSPQPWDVLRKTEDRYVGDWDETRSRRTAHASLVVKESRGWDTGVQLMNLSRTQSAKVKLSFVATSGDVVATLVDWICPLGSQRFALPLIADIPADWSGSLQVDSLRAGLATGSEGPVPAIAGVVTLERFADAARSERMAAAAYALQLDAPGLDQALGVAQQRRLNRIALPAVGRPAEGPEPIGLVALKAGDGTTSQDLRLEVFDQRGPLASLRRRLDPRQVWLLEFGASGNVLGRVRQSLLVETGDLGAEAAMRQSIQVEALSFEWLDGAGREALPGDTATAVRGSPVRILASPGTAAD